mgnify:CR=1 FL=1
MRFTQEIRQAIAAIIPDDTFTVYDYEKRNLMDANLPAVTVGNGNGSWESANTECYIDFRINIIIKADDNEVQNELDDYAEIVEPLFPIGSTLNGLVEFMNPDSFDYVLDNDSSTGTMVLNFNVKYEK